jgi:1,4-dihydroxy-2-naphthoate octaprenyltransferase
MIPSTWARIGRSIKSLCAIRRLEFFPIEICTFTMPLLLGVQSIEQLWAPVVLEGFLTFFLLFSLGDIINCLADRELDQTYKGRLSQAVETLGVGFVKGLVVALAVLSLLLGAHLAWITGKGLVLVLVVLELVLGIQYSVGPIHFKSRGLAQLPCLWLILFFLPMLFVTLLVQESITLPVLLVICGFGTIEMGVGLVNTSEDWPEDLAQEIRTITVALGLRNTLRLAVGMVVLGGLTFAGTWAGLCLSTGLSTWGLLAPLALVAACCWTSSSLWRLASQAATAPALETVRLIRAHGVLIPVWAALIGWGGLACGSVFFLARIL